MKNKPKNPRYLAVKTLERVSDGAYSNLQINNVIDSTSMNQKDVRLFTTIVYGVIQHRLTFEYYLGKLVKNTSKLKPWVKELLYTSMYQMIYLDKVPNRAIFDESIEIAKQRGHDGIRRLVTGVLHKIDRSGLPSFADIKNPLEKLSIMYSVPVWIIKELNQQVGKEKTESILKTINQPSKQSIRVNTKKTDIETLSELLNKANFETKVSKVAANALIVSGGAVAHTQMFYDGLFTIQDESAMLPVQAMEIKDDDYVLDACAAPGGKTTQIAEKLTTGKVEALDLHKNKLKMIERNAERMGLSGQIITHECDARKVDQLFTDDVFNEILVDAPCTGLGLIRRKPEIRYDKSMQDVEHLHEIQLQILDAVASKVKIGGEIIFSTCTILNQENSNNVIDFLKSHENFEPIRIKTKYNLKDNRKENYLRIFPDDYDSDGFFISGFKRVK